MACSGCARRRAKLREMLDRRKVQLDNWRDRNAKTKETKDAKTSEK